MNLGEHSRWLAALFLGAACLNADGALDAAPEAPLAPQPGANACDFDSAAGLEFRFSTADDALRPYGYVLWKDRPSLRAEPLDYAGHHGRRGKLSGRSIVRDGQRWFEARLDDCSRVWAEDTSRHSKLSPVDHLAFYGKVVFRQWREDARWLIGRSVLVRGGGLEPRHRLYTGERGRDYPLHDGEALSVTGIDTHRHAHAKGVGPFFLTVSNRRGESGLIKYNPRYLELPRGPLALRHLAPRRHLAQAGQEAPAGYVLTVSHFLDRQAGLAAAGKLEQGGFNARLLPFDEGDGSVIYKLQIAGLASAELAAEMARLLADRFDWVGGSGRLSN